MSHLPNPFVHKSVIRQESVLEDSSDSFSRVSARVLCSHSSARYELGEVIKKTIYGAVIHGVVLAPVPGVPDVYIRTERDVAIKVFAKHLIVSNLSRSREQPLNEMSLLQYLGNQYPYILGQIECCADDKNMYSVMPWVHGGELFDHIATQGPMTEAEVKPMFYRLMLAIQRLHEMQIAHRDISLENIMYNPEDCTTKVIDFGMALPLFHRHHDHDTRGIFDTVNDMCGKVNYMAPEVIRGDRMIDPFAVDIWAAGVVLFYCLLGFPPMERASPDDQRYALIMGGELRPLLKHWQIQLSDEVLSLIMLLLTENSAARPSLTQILRHPWLQSAAASVATASEISHSHSLSHYQDEVEMMDSVDEYDNRFDDMSPTSHNITKKHINNLNNSQHSSSSSNSSSSAAAQHSAKMQLRSLSRREAAQLHTMGNIMHASG